MRTNAHTGQASDQSPRLMLEADAVRLAYFDDPTLSHAEYGQLVEEADEADQARALELERPEL